MKTFELPPTDEIVRLLTALQREIADDYRCTDDPEDDQPGMLVTIGAKPDGSWNYQTGDNSYTGGAYGFPFWGVGYLYRDSEPTQIAGEILDELGEAMADCPDDDA